MLLGKLRRCEPGEPSPTCQHVDLVGMRPRVRLEGEKECYRASLVWQKWPEGARSEDVQEAALSLAVLRTGVSGVLRT